MKVVHIASGDLWAGAEVQLYNIAEELNEYEDITLSVVLFNHGLLEEKLKQINVNVIVLDESRFTGLRILFKLIKYLHNTKPDIVHTHRQKENILGSIASIFTPRAKSLRTVHGAEEFKYKAWQIHKHIYHFADHICGNNLQKVIISVSDPLASNLRTKFTRAEVVVIENGLNIESVRKSIDKNKNIPFPECRKKLAFVGRLVPVKRVDIFLNMAQILSTDDPSFRFYIFGEGPLLNEAKELCAKLGLDSFVAFMGMQTELPSYLKKMDAIIITSDHEGLPMTLLEALALEIPVISNEVGAIPKVLSNGRYGTLIKEQTAAHFAEATNAFFNNKDQHNKQAKNALAHVSKYYSSEIMAKKYFHLYEKLCK